MADRSVAPPVSELQFHPLNPAETVTLTNGVRVLYLPDPKLEMLRLELIFQQDYNQDYGLVQELGKMLTHGTDKKSSRDIVELFEFYGAYFDLKVNRDYVKFTLFTQTAKFRPAFDLLLELIHESSFPDEEWEIVRSSSLSQLEVLDEKTAFHAQRLFHNNLFGENHFYASFADAAALKSIKAESFRQILPAVTGNFKLATLAGNISADDFGYLSAKLGEFELNSASSALINSVPEYGSHRWEMENTQQASIRLGGKAIDYHQDDYQSFNLMNELLGGYFGSRLMTNLREEKGLTYGIYSRIVHFVYGDFWFVAGDIKKEETELALSEIRREIARLQNESVPESELANLTNYLKGQYLSSIGNIFDMMDQHKTLFLNNLSEDYFRISWDFLSEAKPSQIQQAAQKYISQDQMVQVVAL